MVIRVPATTALIEPATPGWAQRMVLKLLNYFQPQVPLAPNQLWQTTAADLPPASDWPGALAWLTDQKRVVVSNGSTWGAIA